MFDYAQAVRERVLIPQPGIDQDGDGADDVIAVEIIRPPGSGPASGAGDRRREPVLHDGLPRQRDECIGDVDGDGVNDRWPLFYDNYFVPRGYAYVLAEMDGTGNSTGCPLHGGPGDIAGMKSVIDWLNGARLRLQRAGRGDRPELAQRQRGDDRQVLRRHARQRRRGDRRRGAEDDRPDLGDLRVVPLLAPGRDPLQHQLPRLAGEHRHERGPATGVRGVARGDERHRRRRDRRPQRLLGARDYEDRVGDVRAAVFATHGLQDDNVKLDHSASGGTG